MRVLTPRRHRRDCSVIKVILQFCRENNLTESFAALSAECQARWCALALVAAAR